MEHYFHSDLYDLATQQSRCVLRLKVCIAVKSCLDSDDC